MYGGFDFLLVALLYIVSLTLSLPGLRVALLIVYPWESVEDLSFGLLLEWD
jgi:hypothetical protein